MVIRNRSIEVEQPVIGSKYDGPALDRPSIRQLPREWTLEETMRDRRPSLYDKLWDFSLEWIGGVAVFILICLALEYCGAHLAEWF